MGPTTGINDVLLVTVVMEVVTAVNKALSKLTRPVLLQLL